MDEIAMLRTENETLRERIADLEQQLYATALVLPCEWRLTAIEQRLFCALLARPQVTKDMLMTAIYRDVHRDEPEIKIVDVHVCKIRKKLTPFRIVIRTIWAQGYAIDEPQRSTLRAGLAADRSDTPAGRILRTPIGAGAVSMGGA